MLKCVKLDSTLNFIFPSMQSSSKYTQLLSCYS